MPLIIAVLISPVFLVPVWVYHQLGGTGQERSRDTPAFYVNKRYTVNSTPTAATDKDRNDESQGMESGGRSDGGSEFT